MAKVTEVYMLVDGQQTRFTMKQYLALRENDTRIDGLSEKKLSEDTMSQIWGLIHAVLYLCYDPNEAFLPQLQTNSQKLLALLDEIPLK